MTTLISIPTPGFFYVRYLHQQRAQQEERPYPFTQGESEGEIYILSWSQVHVTGPRHHLTSSLRVRAQGDEGDRNRSGTMGMWGLQVWSVEWVFWYSITVSIPLCRGSIDFCVSPHSLTSCATFQYTTHPAPVRFFGCLSFIDPSVYVIVYLVS